MPRCIIRFIGCYEPHRPHRVVGGFLRLYDPAWPTDGGYDGGCLITTPYTEEAKVFDGPSEAFEFWRQQAPEPYHLRPDGKPNRPLTAFTIELVNV